jgi:hypothetical protein
MSHSSTNEYDVQVAEQAMFREHLQQRARICYAMVAGGMVCLVAGVSMLIAGLSGDQVVWLQTGVAGCVKAREVGAKIWRSHAPVRFPRRAFCF